MSYDLDTAKATKFISEKWKRGSACPLCGTNSWRMPSKLSQLGEYVPEAAVLLSGAKIPVLAITCTNCGNTILLNAIVMGVVDGDVSKRVSIDAPKEKEHP